MTESELVFRAIKKESIPITPPSAYLIVTPSPVVSSSTIDGVEKWRIDNEIINDQTATYTDFFTWQFVANAYTPVSLRFFAAPLRKIDNINKKIDFDIKLEIFPSAIIDYNLYKQVGSLVFEPSPTLYSSNLTDVVANDETLALSCQVQADGEYDCLGFLKQTETQPTYFQTPFFLDYITNATADNGKVISHYSSTSLMPHELTFHLNTSLSLSETNYPINMEIVRTGKASVLFDIPTNLMYGEYVSQLYIELEVL